MTNTHTAACPYCDTEFTIEFESEDDELMYCPSCGEQLPTFDNEDGDAEDYWFGEED